MSETQWESWDESKSYDYLDRTGRYQHASGALPADAMVQFEDGDIGYVVHSNSEKSLIHYSNTREWFPNSILKVPAR